MVGGRDEEERREGNCGKDGIYERRIKKEKTKRKLQVWWLRRFSVSLI